MDKREDAGEFYPGGKVISTRPVATGGDVKHSDFAGLDVKTNTIPDLRDAVRELGRRLGATVVTALAACVATAATVQTIPVNDIDFDANPSVVTNVVFDAPPDFSTNNTELVETIEATAPTPDLSPFLRKDLGQSGFQEFGGFLSGMGFHVTHEVSNFNGWNNYTAKNGPTQPMQSLPQYIQSNPWGFALTNDFVRKSGDVMTGSMTIAYDDNLLSIYPDSIYFSGATGVNYIYYPDNIYGYGEIGYDDLHYRGGFDIFATREWTDHRAHAAVTNTVPAWARAATKPAYTATEVGAYSTNETMYVDWIGDIGCIYGDYMPSGVWDFGDGCIRIASWYQFNLHMTPSRQADGIEIFDTSDPTIKTVIPINGSDVATIADIPDVPASVSNIVTAAYINDRVNVTPLAGRTYDFATNIGLYTAVRDIIQALGGSVTNFPAIPQN